MTRQVRESHAGSLLRDKTGRIFEAVLVEAGMSKNQVFYPPDVLREAVPLFEKSKIRIYRFGDELDHVPERVLEKHPQGLVANSVGFSKNCRYDTFERQDGSTGEGIIADIVILDGFEWLQKSLKSSFEHGNTNPVGLSIDVDAMLKPTVIKGVKSEIAGKILRVYETTMVDHPSAGGGLIRLVASKGKKMNINDLYSFMKSHRASWFKGFADIDTEKDDIGGHVIRVLESNLSKAEELLDEISNDEVDNLAQSARGIKAIREAVNHLKKERVEEAGNSLHWIKDFQAGDINPYLHPFTKTETKTEAPKTEVVDMSKENTEVGNAEAKMAEREKELKVRESAIKVTERLTASELLEMAKERVTEMFVGKIDLTDEEIDKVIEKERTYASSLRESGKPKDLGDAHDDASSGVKVTEEQEEKWAKAWDGFFDGGHAVEGVQPFRGLRDAWGAIVNKWDHPEVTAENIFRAIQLALPADLRQFANRDPIVEHTAKLREAWNSGDLAPRRVTEAITTSNFSTSFGVAMFKRLTKEFNEASRNDWRQFVSSIENLQDATSNVELISMGGQGILPIVNENAPYVEGTDPTEVVETLNPEKRGRLFKITWEDVLADRVGVIRRIPRILARSSNRTIQRLVFDEIENNPNMADGNPLIDAAHNNLVSGSPALTQAEFENAVLLLRDMPEQDSNEKLGLSPRWLVTGPKIEATAVEITDSRTKVNAGEDETVTNVNNRWGVSSFFSVALGRAATTEDRWWVTTDPMDAETIVVGFLGGRDRPDIFVQGMDTPTSGSFFDADAITFKTRLVVAAQVADFRWITGSLFDV